MQVLVRQSRHDRDPPRGTHVERITALCGCLHHTACKVEGMPVRACSCTYCKTASSRPSALGKTVHLRSSEFVSSSRNGRIIKSDSAMDGHVVRLHIGTNSVHTKLWPKSVQPRDNGRDLGVR